MNERIKKLSNQAYDNLFNQTGNIVVFDEDFQQRFAELIVRECSRVIVNGGYWSGGPLGPKRQCTPPEIAQMIKEHFGVEE